MWCHKKSAKGVRSGHLEGHATGILGDNFLICELKKDDELLDGTENIRLDWNPK